MGPPKKPLLASHLTDAERRRLVASTLYEVETAKRERRTGDPALAYDAERELEAARARGRGAPSPRA